MFFYPYDVLKHISEELFAGKVKLFTSFEQGFCLNLNINNQTALDKSNKERTLEISATLRSGVVDSFCLFECYTHLRNL